MAAADAADGVADGVARLEDVVLEQNSWKFSGEETDSLGSSVAAAGDLDGDGKSDLIFGAADQFGRYGACGSKPGGGLAIVLSSGQLADADSADGAKDGVVDFQDLRRSLRAVDFDYDGTEDELDTDDDGDGTSDATDVFPYDPLESSDNDSDGIGDNSDSDDDNDGVLDPDDAFPLNSLEIVDSDGDGTGDNADTDDDNDGTNDSDDAFPFDATETADSDGDGIGDNADPEPNGAAAVTETDTDGDGTVDRLDADDDNDGVDDAEDLFDLDDSRSDLFFYKLVGEAKGILNGDFDGDGLDDLVVKARAGSNTTYLRLLRGIDYRRRSGWICGPQGGFRSSDGSGRFMETAGIGSSEFCGGFRPGRKGRPRSGSKSTNAPGSGQELGERGQCRWR